MAVAKALERKGMITFKGGPLTLVGREVNIGDAAYDFKVLDQDLSEVSFLKSKGRVRIISSVPSLDTPVCDTQTRRFNEEASRLGPSVEVWTISMDLPFAQKRWCAAAGIDRIKVFSDHRDADFANAFGCLIKELRLLTRAVFIVDKTNVIRYAEYVEEITTHPNYEAVLDTARKIVQ